MGPVDLLGWIMFGLIVGLVARLLVPGRDPMGWIGTVFLGVLGSVVGGLFAYALRLGTYPYAPSGWILSVVGAMVALMFYYKAIGTGRRA
jgi:uncharacterized membrane protein YeaQ/YmgE (transglycosylase-associated protein family)